MGLQVEDHLERQADAPEDGNVGAEPARQSGSRGEGVGVAQADRAESYDREHDVAAVDPEQLSQDPRQASQLRRPPQLEGNQRRGDEHGKVHGAGHLEEERQTLLIGEAHLKPQSPREKAP